MALPNSIAKYLPYEALHSFFRALGYRVVRSDCHPRPVDFLRSRQVDFVIDVGANAGQFGTVLRKSGYKGRILSFEPLPELFDRLEAVAAKSPPWSALNLALGEREEAREINVTSHSQLSSFKTLSHPELGVERKQNVHIRRLDDVLAGMELGRPFLKIDTQGFEEQVLLGARETLGKFHGVLMELPIEHLYNDVWTFEAAVAFMRTRGFVISSIETVLMYAADPVSLWEVDCLFKNVNLPPP
jgi:FkbM family methyltransferase